MNPVVTSELARQHQVDLLWEAAHYRFATAAAYRRSTSRTGRFGRLRRPTTHRADGPDA